MLLALGGPQAAAGRRFWWVSAYRYLGRDLSVARSVAWNVLRAGKNSPLCSASDEVGDVEGPWVQEGRKLFVRTPALRLAIGSYAPSGILLLIPAYDCTSTTTNHFAVPPSSLVSAKGWKFEPHLEHLRTTPAKQCGSAHRFAMHTVICCALVTISAQGFS
eukprot:486205-Rhodomonas_salina.1